LIKAPFAKTYKIIKTASHAASHDLEMLGGEVRKNQSFNTNSSPTKKNKKPYCVVRTKNLNLNLKPKQKKILQKITKRKIVFGTCVKMLNFCIFCDLVYVFVYIYIC
ncbi:Hypothetical predicted protein, partial [Drosophila guanche]